MSPCLECTDIAASSGTCATCIFSQCGAMLNGRNGCCGSSEVANGIKSCTDPNTGSFGKDLGKSLRDASDDVSYCTANNFAHCVVDHCVTSDACLSRADRDHPQVKSRLRESTATQGSQEKPASAD
jgi:hypothetical protein